MTSVSSANDPPIICRCRSHDPEHCRGGCNRPSDCLGTRGDDTLYCEHCIVNRCRHRHLQANWQRANPTHGHQRPPAQCKCLWDSFIGCDCPQECEKWVPHAGCFCNTCQIRSCKAHRVTKGFYKQFSRETGLYFAARRTSKSFSPPKTAPLPDKPAEQQENLEGLLMDPGETMPPTLPSALALDNGSDTDLYDHFSTDFDDSFFMGLDDDFSRALVAKTAYESDGPFMGFGGTLFPPDDTFPDHD